MKKEQVRVERVECMSARNDGVFVDEWTRDNRQL
jgi:hypothetical protein